MKNILVIEDHQDVRENICEILELDGYQVRGAPNGKAGLHLARELKPDLILCDVMMPELDGFGVIKILQSSPDLYDVPLVFLTARTEMQDLRRAMNLGAEDYLLKPFDDVDLLTTIENKINKKERIQASAKNKTKTLLNPEAGMADLLQSSENHETLYLTKNDVLFQPGKSPHRVYYLEAGHLSISRENYPGKELICHIVGPGQCIGHAEVILRDTYELTARAITDSKIISIPTEDFLKCLHTSSDLMVFFLHSNAERQKDLENQMTRLAYGTIYQRLAHTLLAFQKCYPEGQPIEVSRDVLAAHMGVAKETLVRKLSEIKSQGVIDIRQGHIHILKADQLRKWLKD